MNKSMLYILLLSMTALLQGCQSTSSNWSLKFEAIESWEGGSEYVFYLMRGEEQTFIGTYSGGPARKLSAEEMKKRQLPDDTFEAIYIGGMSAEDGEAMMYITGRGGAERLFFTFRKEPEAYEILPDLLGDWVSYEKGYDWINFGFLYATSGKVPFGRIYHIKEGKQIIIDDNPPETFTIQTIHKNQLHLIDALGNKLTYERPEEGSWGTEEALEEGQASYDYSVDFEAFKKAVTENAAFDWEAFVSIEGQSGADYKALFGEADIQFAIKMTDYNNLPGKTNDFGEAIRVMVVSIVDENDQIIRPAFTFTESEKGLRLTGYSCCE
jgi:hypothetical protein